MARTELTLTSSVPLRGSEARMPVLGFGVYQIDRPDCAAACLRALSAGYRHIDTAQIYQNEEEVGAALRCCGLPREAIFVTTKIRYPRLGKGKTYLRALQSVRKIDPRDDGYVDLFLVHSPHALKPKDRKELWLALEKLHAEGRIRAIGVSNYQPEHLEEMKGYATVWPPAVNQILLHPWTQQRETVDYCNEHGIILQAFSPLARGMKLREPALVGIAEKVGKSPAQVLIRYCLQKGWVPLPKSEKEEHIEQNADVFCFSISQDDMATLDGLDRRQGPKFE
ncbi:aldo/keto reductase [Hypoxylon rubiginosum]|uniref:Aldo/keto reductase n=1 Tax=Hypoxylon rubiginosum TaxID=110542 RepID=A0ACB9YYK1_9PEZI|nr:aldo/keto reductase [Hypoxylon rubiginosum]